MIKGFTTLKFGIACALAYLALYCIYSLIQIWDEEDLELKKIIAVLFALIAIAIMKLLDSHVAIKQFVLGAGRYNQIRHVNESMQLRVPSISKTTIIQQNANKQRQGNAKTKTTYDFNKIKKQFSMQPADLLKFSMNEQDLNNSRSGKFAHRSFSASMVNTEDNLNLASLQRKKRNQQIQKLTDDYKQYIKKSNKIQQIQQQKLKKAKTIIGNIYKNQINKQLTNIRTIIQKIQNMFDIHVVEFNSNRNQKNYINNNKTFSSRQQIGKIHLKNDRQIQLDQILNNYNKGLLWKCGYKIKRNVLEQDAQYRQKLAYQIELAIKQRKILDKQINYKSIFIHHSDRINTINNLGSISKNLLQNKQMLSHEHNITQDFQVRYTMIWLLSRHVNELVKNKLRQATVYLQQHTEQQNKQSYIRWLPRNTEMLVHFNIIIDKMIGANKSKQQIVCKPGQDNILSVFVNYLQHIGKNYKQWVGSIPELDQYINFDIYYDQQTFATK